MTAGGQPQVCCAGPGKGGTMLLCQVGCAISRRDAKTDIRYLDDAARRHLHDQLMALGLASYRYRAEGPEGPLHLGFIIDDLEDGAARQACVRPDGQSVDLYGYISTAVAALQVQQAEMAALRRELRAVQEQLRSIQPADAAPSAPRRQTPRR
jgi:hypothetical protein